MVGFCLEKGNKMYIEKLIFFSLVGTYVFVNSNDYLEKSSKFKSKRWKFEQAAFRKKE